MRLMPPSSGLTTMSDAIRWWRHGDHPSVGRRGENVLAKCRLCGGILNDGSHGVIATCFGWQRVCPGDYIEPDGDGFRVRRAER